MKNVILILFFMLAAALTFAQKSKSKTTKESAVQQTTTDKTASQKITQPDPKLDSMIANKLREHFAKKRVVANRWNDPDVTKDVLFDLIVEDPGNDSLIMELAFQYFENQKYASSILVGQDLLKRNPRNEKILELVALSFENLNIFDRALQNYESLFLLSTNAGTLYKMAFLQYELKRFPESLTNADILLSKPEAETLKVVFNNTDNKQKEYTAKVALLNLKGMIYKEQGDKINAKKFFEEALKIAPDFLFAKENLAALK